MAGEREYDRPAIYEIRIKGKLDARWSRWFADLRIVPLPDGECLLAGFIRDQAALYGAISRLRDLGVVLVSVQRVPREKDPKRTTPDLEELSKR